MSPVIGGLLHVPSQTLWVGTFIAVYSGLIPMFSTAGNTTDDGVVGAILEDCFRQPMKYVNREEGWVSVQTGRG